MRIHHYLSVILGVSSLVLCVTGRIHAQETTGLQASNLPDWKQYCELEIGKYALFPTGRPNSAWTKTDKPVFSHRNPFNREELGLVYLWVDDNQRPVAAGTVIVSRRNKSPNWYDVHELHSLWDEPFEATYSGKPAWKPSTAGLRWQTISGGPQPAKDHRRLQRQAKGLARQFNATQTQRGSDWELHLTETPIYQYDVAEKDIDQPISGAVFAFCRATDPEALLVLEVRRDDSGSWRWHFAPAAFSFSPTTFRHSGNEVWSESLGRAVYSQAKYHHGAYRNKGIRIADPN